MRSINAPLGERFLLPKPSEETFDIAVVGAGVVGCALAFRLSLLNIRVIVIEQHHDVGEGTSKGNSAIVHTGFDATPGSLESQLVTRASRIWPSLAQKLKIPLIETGALLAALDDEQHQKLDKIHAKALANGVDDVHLLSRAEALELEPTLAPTLCGGLHVPRESIVDPFTTSVACAEVALTNGCQILLGAQVVAMERNADNTTIITAAGTRISTRIVVNTAGLGSRHLADLYGGAPFDINPRRGQFVILDRFSRSLTRGILLPVPTAKTKGVLVFPTVFGNIVAGPTAEDLPLGDPKATDTTVEGLQWMLDEAARLCPDVTTQPVIGAYAGARCNCEQGSYQLRYNDGWPNVVTVAGIRSTGLTSSFALADHLIDKMSEHCGLSLEPSAHATDSRPESAWPGWWKKAFEGHKQVDQDLYRVVCSCEAITKGEIIAALDSPLKPRTLDAVKRRTRSMTGRCQGFECTIGVASIISEHCAIRLEEVSKKGPGSELLARECRHG
ncbi:MAG: NAD(P)/FAD-dependent oxidoreductase [Proteobacteria bacterium]|nr:NAD(P)/FAD-dependent oxidoreductase [Pseudomonadota bacterium]